jgi:serine phosphatase RsbU (regulator of sigma subunit)
MAVTATVLVADDSALIRAWAGRLLAEAGHRVVLARDGAEALEMARHYDPDVLLIDEVMPGIQGRELVGRLRDGGSVSGIVMLTGSAAQRMEADALRMGVDDFLLKPCDEAALSRAIDAARMRGAARRRRREREEEMDGELRAAAAIQTALLPPAAAAPPGWELECGFLPARDVGGDLYDVITEADGRLVLVLADVSGKGVAAALLAAMCQTALRSGLARGDDPAQALAATGRLLHPSLERAGRFLTAVVVEIDPPSGRLRYADAGHGHHLLTGGGGLRALDAGGMPLGFSPDAEYPLGVEQIAPGDTLALFSDGLVEGDDGISPDAALEALAEALAARRPASELVAEAADADDRTLVVLRRLP